MNIVMSILYFVWEKVSLKCHIILKIEMIFASVTELRKQQLHSRFCQIIIFFTRYSNQLKHFTQKTNLDPILMISNFIKYVKLRMYDMQRGS